MNEPLVHSGVGHAALGPRPSPWPTRLLVLLGVALTLLLAATWLVQQLPDIPPFHIIVDGWEYSPDRAMNSMPPAHKVMLAAVILAAVLAALVIVPLAVLLSVMVVLFVVLLAVGLPLMLALGVLALLLSPLLLLIWLLWKLLA